MTKQNCTEDAPKFQNNEAISNTHDNKFYVDMKGFISCVIDRTLHVKNCTGKRWKIIKTSCIFSIITQINCTVFCLPSIRALFI